jgi:D-tyrosyl-tRNA(Tyr) deacylase
MRLIIQRVTKASVEINRKIVAAINQGYLVLLAIHKNDTLEAVDHMAQKLLAIRIMPDQDNKMNRSIKEASGEILVVSQFTLYADTSSRRPGFTKAASKDWAKSLYGKFIMRLQESGLNIANGRFGEHMRVELVNDGPVTIILDSDQ